MILSASRRTDIPAFYSSWFMNRIREGYVVTKNPFNPNQIFRVSLDPNVIDCIVFWTKNPEPMLSYLEELDRRGYKYYFQYTLNAYGKDIESGVPESEKLISTFIKLSEMIGKHRVVWRYDPILINSQYDVAHHVHKFDYICSKLSKYTEKCVISFIDIYKKNKNNLKNIKIQDMKDEQIYYLAQQLSDIAQQNAISLETCSEKINLGDLHINHGKCIDDQLISRIVNGKIDVKKDNNQREECGCVNSIDIGAYNSCKHSCIYCYANYSLKSMKNNIQQHDTHSPLLIGNLNGTEVIKEKDMKSLIIHQTDLLDK